MCITWHRLLVTLAFISGFCVLPRVSFAQSDAQPEPNPADLAIYQYGSFAFTPAFVFSIGHDSNVTREPPPNQLSVFETYVVPQFEAFWTAGRARLRGFSAFEVIRDGQESQAQPAASTDTAAEKGGGNWTYGLEFNVADSPIKPLVSYTWRQTNARPTGFEIGAKSLRIENQLTVGSQVRAGAKTTFGVRADVLRINYDAAAIYQDSSLQQKLNRDTTSAQATVGYEITPLTSLGLLADVVRDRFKFSPERDGDSFRVLPSISLASPAAVTGSAYVGFRHFTSKASGTADFSGLVANGQLLYSRPSGLLTVVRFQRDLQFSFDESLGYYVLTGADGSVTKRVFDRWDLLGAAGTYTLDYRPAGTVGLSSDPDRVFSFTGAAGYRIGSWMRVGVSVERYQRNGQFAYDGVRVASFVTYGSGHFQRLDRPIPFEQY